MREDCRKAFIKDLAEIATLREGRGDLAWCAQGVKIERFRFIPGDAGLLCIDIDMGCEGGANGLASFYAFFAQRGLALPDYLQHIQAGSFPCYTKNPSGGFHSHFKHKGMKRYILVGSFAQAPTLPAIIENSLTPYQDEKPGVVKPHFIYERPDWQKIPPPLSMIPQWDYVEENFDGWNRLRFEIARRAARTDYGYTATEVEDFLRSCPQTAGHKQIKDAVKSAFKGRKL